MISGPVFFAIFAMFAMFATFANFDMNSTSGFTSAG
jgi:hypothetical protein